ncbi:hypothetical protein ZWY2020_013084 [Hordeum vulgare]|nr:hypothetical protein ZWY2020_013084 [Hordeum vulgare]
MLPRSVNRDRCRACTGTHDARYAAVYRELARVEPTRGHLGAVRGTGRANEGGVTEEGRPRTTPPAASPALAGDKGRAPLTVTARPGLATRKCAAPQRRRFPAPGNTGKGDKSRMKDPSVPGSPATDGDVRSGRWRLFFPPADDRKRNGPRRVGRWRTGGGSGKCATENAGGDVHPGYLQFGAESGDGAARAHGPAGAEPCCL